MIEQKSIKIILRNSYEQEAQPGKKKKSQFLTAYQQAINYFPQLPFSQWPRWIILCNFYEFLIYDMEYPQREPQSVLLKNLGRDFHCLDFLVNPKSETAVKEEKLSVEAGKIVSRLYHALLNEYLHPEHPETLRSLNALCVRIVFCLYAEDTGVFEWKQFHDYLNDYSAEDMADELGRLFEILDTPEENRRENLKPKLAAFPYVNGGLFNDKNISIPKFTNEIRRLLLEDASEKFNWSDISPTIFGAIFESTMNPETRRSGGMHYTSIENIHKVIDPLFLDDLRRELATIFARNKGDGWRLRYMKAFHDKLAGLHFLDPACGSGNFLTETYLSIRRMENQIIQEMMQYSVFPSRM